MALGALALAAPPSLAADPPPAELRFVEAGRIVARVSREDLMKSCGTTSVVIVDPYYKREISFLGCPLDKVLERGFGDRPAAEDVFLRAKDGYTATTTLDRLFENGAFLAVGDARKSAGGVFAFEPIDRRQVDPGPFYMIWSKPGQTAEKGYPWPYQLVEIEVASFDRAFPHTLPSKAARDSAAWDGFRIFRNQCISCHAINGEGGKIGPDLNVPQSIVEYRPVEQIKDYVRDPSIFRYTSMPAHTHFTAAELDSLIAYFRAMSHEKHDAKP